MAREMGISEATVRRIHANGLKPVKSFKISKDNRFAEELEGHCRPVSESARTRHRAVR
jgi:hypothetical protein